MEGLQTDARAAEVLVTLNGSDARQLDATTLRRAAAHMAEDYRRNGLVGIDAPSLQKYVALRLGVNSASHNGSG